MPDKDLLPSIAEAAAQPRRAQGTNGSMEQQPIGDMIKADQYAKAAARRRGLPFRRVQLRPGNNADVDVRGGM